MYVVPIQQIYTYLNINIVLDLFITLNTTLGLNTAYKYKPYNN